MTSPAPPPEQASSQLGGLRRVLLQTGYNLSAFPISLVAFVMVLTVMVTGVALSVIIGGVLLLAGGVMISRGVASLERIRIRGMLGREAVTPRYLGARPGDGFWSRTLLPFRDTQSWLDVVWSLLGLVTGILAFVITVTWWAGMAGGLTYWFWQRYLPVSAHDGGLVQLLGIGTGPLAESVWNFGAGIFFLLTLPFAIRLAAIIHASLAQVLLCSRADLQREVARVEGGRAAARMAEAESLRRLERDIHDGPQQRLVRLGMDLSRARRQLDHDPARAAVTIDEALAQTRATVAELRSLSRGIAPPLLVDRGLAAALHEMLAQSVVPVTSTIKVPADLPPHVETAVYFVVAEALTNIAKHSAAKSASVSVLADGALVEVRVEDDGLGGAHPAKGLGLAGLRQRLVSVDGSLEITSPVGGGTIVHAKIPL